VRTRGLRDSLNPPPQLATTAPQVNPVASRLRRAGPLGPSTAADAAAAFPTPALAYPQWQDGRTPGVELAASQEVMSAYLDLLMAAVTRIGRRTGLSGCPDIPLRTRASSPDCREPRRSAGRKRRRTTPSMAEKRCALWARSAPCRRRSTRTRASSLPPPMAPAGGCARRHRDRATIITCMETVGAIMTARAELRD
jgi:hypothetical protein